MKTFFLSYIFAIIPLLILDGIWLNAMIKRFYGPKLIHLTALNPSFLPAFLFYIIYAVGIVVFIMQPALAKNLSFEKVLGLGALLGLVSYGAYDFTNQATLREWPAIITIVDLLWGTFLTATVGTISVYITRMFL